MTITDNCTGCRACEQLCPKHCISIRPDNEGFMTAYIDKEKCIECGLCKKRCPQNRSNLLNQTTKRVIGARLKDEQTLHKSASGGAFAGLAIDVIKNGGIVYGVRYDKQLRAFHSKAESFEELIPLLSSKYVQSNTEHTYAEVKDNLKDGRKVLYSGTGCQIAGLKSYLNKDFPNLILVDLICHGVTSPLLFSKYIDLLERKHHAKIEEFNFRDKKGGWGLGYKYKYSGKNRYGICNMSPYYKYFLDGNAYRECCYKCKYAKTKRCGDITIADYWGIEKFHPQFYSTKGVSLILINTPKGNDLWETVSADFYSIESKLEYAIIENENLTKPTKRNDDIRNNIYKGINTMPVEDYFATRLPFKPSIIDKIKNILPIWIKLVLKRLSLKYNIF